MSLVDETPRTRWRVAVMCTWEPAFGAPVHPVGVLGWHEPASPDAAGEPLITDWVPPLCDYAEAEAQLAWQRRVDTTTLSPAESVAAWSAASGGLALVPVDVPDGVRSLAEAVSTVLDEVLATPRPPQPQQL